LSSDGARVRAALLTREYPPEIYGGAGTESMRGQIDEVMTEVQRWAQELGCKRIRILGRKGWLRRLKGFRLAGYIIEKEI